jgi:hypothetical protein
MTLLSAWFGVSLVLGALWALVGWVLTRSESRRASARRRTTSRPSTLAS